MSPRPLPPDSTEPLTTDERALAERLAQIGPHGAPPPALDARILAAAHAAAARHPRPRAPRRRWPTLVGAAASLVIVVGLAWQLQPLLRTRPSLGEGPVAPAPLPRSEGTLSADVLAAAEPVAPSAVSSPPPPPSAASPAAVTRKTAPPPPAVARAAPAPAPTPAATAFGDDAVPPYTDYAGKAAARQAATRAIANEGAQRALTEPRRERAAAMAPQPFPAASAPAESATAMPAPTAYAPAPVVAAPAYEAAAAAPSPPVASDAAAGHDNTLDRIEVTGTRIRLADLPVRDDARLDPASWLQRIRDRRDAGDIDHALESLALFRRSHPRSRVPDDLARLGR